MDSFMNVTKKKRIKIEIELSKEEIERAAVEAVTINGLPLSVFEKSGVCKLLNPFLNKLDMSLNRSSMKNRVLQQATYLRNEIAAEAEGQLICLKVDIASRNERGFLGINVQYFHEGGLLLRTLAVQEMFERHTGKEIKQCILSVLETFRINIIQVYSITTDNASNMAKCGKLMYDEIEEAFDHELEGDCDERDFLSETIHANVTSAAKQLDMNIFNIHRCGAHTLTLAIEDALKRDEDSKKTLEKAKRVVKKLRNPNLMLKLKERDALKPILDVATRWRSSYDMIERLLVLKPIILDFGTFNEDIELKEDEWLAIEQLKKDLETLRKATIRLQDRLVTAGDLLAEWELMEFMCQINDGSYFSLCLKESLQNRKSSVVEIDGFLGAVYVDLRYHRLLSPEQKECAKKHIYSTWQRIVHKQNCDNPQFLGSSSPILNPITVFPNEDDPLEALLVEKDREIPSTNFSDVNSSRSEMIIKAIEELTYASRLPKSEDIIKYWINHPNQDLRQVCLVVLALPVTQVSVERTFSGLKYILNYLRMRMTPELVDSIMVLRCNV